MPTSPVLSGLSSWAQALLSGAAEEEQSLARAPLGTACPWGSWGLVLCSEREPWLP